MAHEQHKVPVIPSAAEAVGFLRTQWRFALIVALVGAVAQFAVMLTLGPAFGLVGASIVSAGVFAALYGAALFGAAEVPQRLLRDTLRLWLALALFALLLAVAMFAYLLATMGFLIGPYAQEIEAAKADEAAVQAILMRALAERPGAAYAVFGLGALAWLALTSRMYLIGPATVDSDRVRVFETWAWTRGAMLRIVAARLVVLGPALVLSTCVIALLSAAFGFAPGLLFDPRAGAAGAARPAQYFALMFTAQPLMFLLNATLDAGLAARLYRALKPG